MPCYFSSWSGFNDELGWGAAWLYKATGDSKYLTKAEKQFTSQTPTEFSWDNKNAGLQIMLYCETGKSKYKTAVQNCKSFKERPNIDSSSQILFASYSSAQLSKRSSIRPRELQRDSSSSSHGVSSGMLEMWLMLACR